MPRVPPAKPALARASAHPRKGSSARTAVGTVLAKPPPRPPKVRKPRKPRPENHIEPSILRPHVFADERLALWSTPFAQSSRKSHASLVPDHQLQILFLTILEAIEPNTRKNYGAGLLRFHQFCDNLRIPEADRMPASEILLSSFIASWAGKVARTTIDNWLAGLAFWHTLNAAPWLGSRILKVTCAASLKLQPPPRPKRPPVTLEHMHALRDGLDLTDAFDAAVYAVACAAFWGCRRLGELVIPSRRAFNDKRHVACRAGVRFEKIPGSAGSYAVFHIPWTKTTHHEGADVILTGNGDATTPERALRHHLNANTNIPDSAPLFAFETANGSWAPMTHQWFLDRCNSIWERAQKPTLTGHCFRIGGATELLLRGTPPDIVATLGSWKSRAFLEYWRKIESILPLFISKSFDQSRLQLVAESVKSFKKKYHV
ncbi:DNA breaking-rejoining enzyme [Polyporus arcularius HHB13444]|uniref:DNA breaking-rejoining enzyme n=1 Tax=Polyporus arcularius HHB13444 TaxID=1314778 RepID=A0A5C3NYF9_9APHY|nr:DNA breaking-rejoining enzyme [Polyporus arcularius HHB13444]